MGILYLFPAFIFWFAPLLISFFSKRLLFDYVYLCVSVWKRHVLKVGGTSWRWSYRQLELPSVGVGNQTTPSREAGHAPTSLSRS